MKYSVTLAIMTLFALSATAQLSYPLGHHVHEFQRDAGVGTVTSQGWDPTYSVEHQATKQRLVAGIQTYTVGLPNGMEPKDLGNTGCPVNTTIRTASDVAGLPSITLSGVSGPVYVIHDCNADGSILRVQDGMKVAVWGSAFRQVVGNSGSSGEIWIVDSLINANPDDNAGFSCLGNTPCRAMYSEVLGGDDIMKLNPGDVCFKSHLHGYDRDSTKGSASGSGEHNDGTQVNQGSDYLIINCNIEGPFRTSNSPIFAGTVGKIHNHRVVDTLASGGTNSYKLGSKDGTDFQNIVLLNTRLLGDANDVSWGADSYGQSHPCTRGTSGSAFTGEGNLASNGAYSGVDHLGRSWTFDDCNQGSVSSANKTYIQNAKNQLETWTAQIRAAAGAPPTSPPPAAAIINVTVVPTAPYSANAVTVAATVTGCQPALYRFECGDTPGAFDDKQSVASFHICGTMPPGSYTVGVLAQGGTCQSSVSKQIQITVSPPPAPVLQ